MGCIFMAPSGTTLILDVFHLPLTIEVIPEEQITAGTKMKRLLPGMA
jgi:hypothetical protein